MKVFVHFQPKYTKDVYEGMRLRKNIKGALELNNVEIAKNSLDNYDLAHFLSIEDETKINDVLEQNIPVVFSALMCESDPVAKVTDTTLNGQTILRPKALRILNKVNLVIVPNKTSKEFLKEQGVKTKIAILSPGVNISRFTKEGEVEGELFYRYFRLQKDVKTIIAFGQYDNKEEVRNFVQIAKLCPDYKFLYFGQAKHMYTLDSKIRRLIKKSPQNALFNPIVPEDVYRSVMINADIFLIVNRNKFNAITMLDAIAAKCQIIGLGPINYDAKVIDKKYAYISNTLPLVSSDIIKFLDKEIPSNVNKAYSIAKNESLTEIGSKLIELYNNIFEAKKKEGKANA
jgi:1,2-diacylglycerol-3-alpha-glucose alpha-1,2-glucosyltransferase